MIIIEPPLSFTKKRALLNKRDLQQFLAQAQKAVPVRGVVSILLTGDEAVRDLNHRFRHKNEPTDVLSFPAADLGDLDTNLSQRGPQQIVGDMAISIETAARQAHSFGHDLALEIKILILHGLLHLSGLDHEADSGEMAQREQELRKQLKLPTGLIQRSSSEGPRRRIKPSQQLIAARVASNLNAKKTHVSDARRGAPALVTDGRNAKRRSKTP